MTGLISFLLFAGFFFLMMRFGCGAHAGHGGHGGMGDKQSPAGPASDIDPVCGMHVEPTSAYATAYRGISYRFCSRECLDKFNASPDQYVTKIPAGTGHAGHAS